MGAETRARHAREEAQKAAREADRAEARAWSLRMEGYGGPAQPSPTIGQCISGGLGWLEVECNRCKTRASLPLDAHPPAAGYADLEARGIAEMQILPKGSVGATRSHDQADGEAGDHALQVGLCRRFGNINRLPLPIG